MWAFYRIHDSAKPGILVQRTLALHLGQGVNDFDITWTDTWFEDEDYKPMPGAWMDHHVDEVASDFTQYCCDHRITATMRGRAGGYYIPGFTDESAESEHEEESEDESELGSERGSELESEEEIEMENEEESQEENAEEDGEEVEEEGEGEGGVSNEKDVEVDSVPQSEYGSDATPIAPSSVDYDLDTGNVICRCRSKQL